MGKKPTSLKKLDINEHIYYYVEPSVLAKAFNKLEYLELKQTTSQHIVAILQLMAIQTNIVHLTIGQQLEDEETKPGEQWLVPDPKEDS